MSDLRKKRLEHQIQEAVSWVLIRNIDNPKIGFVTITEVKVSVDFRIATVYYSVLGSQKKIDETQAGLSSASKMIQKLVAEKIEFRQVPLLRFKFDETPSKAQKLEFTFRELENEQGGSDNDSRRTEENEESDHSDP
ncbi:MAG TPA: 30S ribosome-binding factor RbfA [Caldisericia bacterium]|nr:30S ribosome-binding factor RbfA [Caldisericia bacterium]HOR46556.1 30S ribosome-binding factor RbfA [Caldisericia bacterium]HOU08654.1 30S ribosome-binding factor RbfA [Caldisericia bacterium]HPL89410.1 30S ribosome-binding factor RbfA [Caldisericia bacterium]HQG59118.1 30S ribosome-binding factor RbfA [Caldisericia bacterium]